jgi:hypothetical protein
LKRADIFFFIYLLTKEYAEIPRFPPFEKGGRRGDLRKVFQKAKLIPKK